jgi:carbamoylphosphate synthase large subunit
MKGWKELEYEVVRDGADVRAYLSSCLIVISVMTFR